MASLLLMGVGACTRQESTPAGKPAVVSSLTALVQMPVDGLKQLDLARMNLLCAEGLPGAEHLDTPGSLAVIDQMVARARAETERHIHRFQNNSAEFENSECFFRMMMLMVVLAEDFRVHYAPDKMASAAQARRGDGFFANAADVFLPGVTGAARRGTCSSLPVLYVAVGRRMGYPLKLVTTKGQILGRFTRRADAPRRAQS